MHRATTKAAAEAALRELPSVLGAFVREDVNGHPREIHVLIRSGPDAGALARDIHGLLEERLEIPIDRRVISIAQLEPDAVEPVDEGLHEEAHVEQVTTSPVPRPHARAVFRGIESTVERGRIEIAVTLDWRGQNYSGAAQEVETANGRARAAATATLRAAMAAAWEGLRLELDQVTVVPAVDQRFVLVSVLGLSPALGRKPLTLVGAQPVETDIEAAAALASLKSINRILSLGLG